MMFSSLCCAGPGKGLHKQNLELDSNSVDLLVNNYMFDLISFEEMDPVLAEFKRVLKPSGKLVLVNMTTDRGMGIYDRLYKLFPKAMGGCRGVELSERLERAGFKVERREFVRQLFFPSEIILARHDVPEFQGKAFC